MRLLYKQHGSNENLYSLGFSMGLFIYADSELQQLNRWHSSVIKVDVVVVMDLELACKRIIIIGIRFVDSNDV